MRRRSLAGGLMLPFLANRARAAGWPDKPVYKLRKWGTTGTNYVGEFTDYDVALVTAVMLFGNVPDDQER